MRGRAASCICASKRWELFSAAELVFLQRDDAEFVGKNGRAICQ